MSITLGSLFDGSGGFPLAGIINDIVPVWSSEIEPYPLKVTAARLPQVKQLGSVLDIDGGKIDPVDIITFGSPCQDLSIAGKQKGIHEGERSNLFFEAIRIIKEMRQNGRENTGTNEHIRPRFAVWENVPGAFSSNKGADFRAVLQALAEIKEPGVSIPGPEKGKWTPAGAIVGDGYSIAWRVYDAQCWGVPQRRKRIYLITDFASERAGEILFERESLCGDSAESGEAGEGVAADVAGSVGRSCVAVGFPLGFRPENVRLYNEKATTLCNGTRPGFTCGVIAVKPATHSTNDGPGVVYDMTHANDVIREYEGTAPTLQHRMGTGGNQVPIKIDKGKPPRKYILRRLTPLECCRLQGFPDWWTDGVEGSDAAQYKMWGNGIALPCAVDVLRRVAKEMEDSK